MFEGFYFSARRHTKRDPNPDPDPNISPLTPPGDPTLTVVSEHVSVFHTMSSMLLACCY